jgi:hypothetical protein
MQSRQTRSLAAHPRTPIAIVVFVTGLALLAVPSVSAAEDGADSDTRESITYLPANSRFASYVDVGKFRNSKYFDQALAYLEDRSANQTDTRIADFLTGKNGFDIRSDLSSLTVGLPVSRVQTPREADTGTFVLSGDFDPDQIRELIRKERDDVGTRSHAGLELLRVDKAEVGFPADNRLVVTTGKESYRNKVWKLATEGGKSFADSGESRGMFDGVDRTKTLWMVNYLKGTSGRADSKVDSAGVSLDVDKGLELEIVSHVADKEHAETVSSQIETMKSSAAESPMISMLGAAPLITNLSVDREETTIVASTSMNESELDALVASLRQMAASQSQMSIPSSGNPNKSSQSGESADESSDSPESNDDSDND